jgi:organic hydroperoxide reductase OsmC/OhrA
MPKPSKRDQLVEATRAKACGHRVEPNVTARIPGIDQDTFQSIAAKAKAGYPVPKLIKVEIGFEATLSP